MTVQSTGQESRPLERPKEPESVNLENVGTGILVPPIERIRLFSPTQWEEFVLEWADSFRDDYFSVDRSGGAGDMGRDVVASVDDSETVWENFQCKHYKSAITPSDIWCEFGKLIYYACRGEFTYPRKYVFVAPQGAGNKLAKLLKDPEKLKNELKANWASYCENAITETTAIPLKGQLLKFLDKADFGIFSAISPLRLIEQHRKTPYHVYRFGGGLLDGSLTDVDGNEEHRDGTISVFNGPRPSVYIADDENAESDHVADWLLARINENVDPSEIAIFGRTIDQLARARDAVRKASDISGHGLGAIRLATMHGAKGLEFRCVCVMACDDDIIPLEERIRAIGDHADLEDIYNTERHLLYVACTRARDQLLITGVDPASEFLEDFNC